MPRLIDADTIFNGELLLVRDVAYDAVHAIIEKINNAPTVDAVPVVRCKDCRWKDNCDIRRAFLCDWYTDDDAYCVDGKRREDGTN